uniref:Reverse transcriptase domain-containing protein n=1 Tax=Tanacetum cinerariifolium TaxID=118510 RepID=A0A6L2N2K7_TANCI|nr:reverse transcriptase domain-containing protein [Tanacetum cinerariifolium]
MVFQPPAYQAPAPQTQGVLKEDFSAYVKDIDAVMKNMQTQGQNMQNQLANLTNLLTKFVNSNNASTSSSGTLPSNTNANPRSDLKAITTRSGVSYDGPQILPLPSFLPKVVENEPEVTKDTMQPTNNGSTEDVQPQVVQSNSSILTFEPVNSPTIEHVNSLVSASRPNLRPSIPYPSRMQDHKLCDKANDQREKIFQIFKDLNFNISFADALILMAKFGPSIKSLLTNNDKLSLADLGASINIMPLSVWNKLSLPDFSPTCMTLELSDRSISRPVGVAEDVYVKVGSFHIPADFVVVDFDADPRVPLILGRSFLKTGRALIDVFERELTLCVGKEAITFNLDQTSRYSPNYNEMTAKRIDVIDMTCKEYSQEVLEVDAFLAIEDDPTSPKVDQSYLDSEGDILLLEVFLNDDPSLPPPNQENYLPEVRKELKIREAKSDKSSIDELPEVELKYLPPTLNMHFWKRRVNPKIHDVIKQEVIKLLDAGLIYPISDSPWVSPVHCVPKNGGFIVVENKDNELILTCLVTGWRVCIDYRKLNEATHKDHFPLPFMDQMLERLAENQYYCFLDGFSGYFQIPIDPKDQEKTTFTCPYGTFAYRRMPFGLCNAPGTFQRCMMAIFHDMIEKTMEVFMDDFSVFKNSFQSCLSYLERMLKRCEDTNLCLNCEKSHFMVKEGIVLGHKIYKQGIEVDKAKVDVITKLPHPTTVKGIRSFLGHADFYCRFIKDFSKIARPMTRLLEKDTPFIFSKECVEAFQTLKRKLTEAPILILLTGICPLSSCAMLATLLLEFTFKVIDTKGAENLAADNLSRLENPHQNVLDPKEIHESFPLETLNLVSTRGVYQARKPLTFSRLATMDPPRDTMAQITQPRRFGTPRAIISDRGRHFCNDQFAKVMQKFGVTQCLATPYHPQTSGQVEVSNRGVKRILERTVGENRASWSYKLDDAL